MNKKYKCPCCGVLSLDEERAWDICELCWWEDDLFQYRNPNFSGGANSLSLNQWRKEFDDNLPNLVKGDFCCSLLEKKITLDICREVLDVAQDLRKKEYVTILDVYKEDYCKEICNSCPIYIKLRTS
ncbi:CPCC family cysteine-rich protein [Clostridium paraputrificum]|uniref:CPCC family cysteine-rich protein n=1 Tax=Clostridium TaxID=1485 RepID=UPI00232C171B|nr:MULTISPECIES: CPCC family cysteine-rich protein [Clostridium]MDB2089203.1 CPCC family cysteine-rich protein [Clostridium paraputrificum]MDB2095669.1 CPCC family cysteine-rich protein [Clostridium paraputrificum]MDU1180806.1 CPCC family cysteine-rich protein [Clostridium sp.]MDU1227310.1 CPCC family cysteine-rich protein [Clostridium sp.]MDU7653370.1 CPCC family cysteine-rich protein [Clostridium sp.]